MRRWAWVLLFVIAPSLFARDAESARKWREDLDVFRRELAATHKNAFHRITREEFDAAVASLAKDVDTLTDRELVVGLGRIVTRIGDGHTHINYGDPVLGYRGLPLRLYLYSDGLFVDGAAKEYSSLVGKRVVRIGGVTAEETLRRAMEITPHDNGTGIKAYAVLPLLVPELLEGLGIVASADAPVEFTVEGGATAKVSAVSIREAMQLEPQRPNFSYEYLADAKAMVVRYNSVYWSDEDSPASFFRKVFAEADRLPVEKLIVDVRQNGGGNNRLNLPIVHELIKRDALNQRGKLFALTGRKTFSAAQNFVNLLEIHTNVLFAGEPTGAAPNHYGDPRPVKLPNSGITVRASSLWWQDHPGWDTRAETLPHIAVDVSPADARAGRDPVLEAVLKWETLTTRVMRALERGIAEGEAEYRAYRDDPRHRHQNIDGESGEIVRALVKEKRAAQALAIAKLNAATYPASSSAHEALAEALQESGDGAGALAEWKKALELSPRNMWLRRKIEVIERGS